MPNHKKFIYSKNVLQNSMPNKIYRKRVQKSIREALEESENAGDVDHPGFQGKIREIALRNIFKPLLKNSLDIGTGKIIDKTGYQTKEIDLAIYSKELLPSVMYSDSLGLFPSETCCYAIEVKSKTNATKIREAIINMKSLKKLNYSINKAEQGENYMPIIRTFFGFKSDLKGKTELERIRELDPTFDTKPHFHVICVVGKGYWYHEPKDNRWVFYPPTADYNEVLSFLSGIMNTIPGQLATRGKPQLGGYLIEEKGMYKDYFNELETIKKEIPLLVGSEKKSKKRRPRRK